jgi:type IV pilus assembly protein PilM
MFGIGKSSKRPLAGIDISSAAVKLIQLSRTGERYQVDGYAVQPLPENIVVDGKINDFEAVGFAIRKAADSCSVEPKYAAVAIPSGLVISKTIQQPVESSEAEVESQLEEEADQHIPHDRDEVAMDFVLRGANEKNPQQQDVLLAACRKEYVEERESSLASAGMEARVVDIETYAMCRAFELFAPALNLSGDALVAIVDIGASTTSLTVLHKGDVIYWRDQHFGGRQLTQEIQKRYGMTFEEAGHAKRQGGLPDDYEIEVLEPFRDGVVQQIERSLTWFYNASNFNEVDMVVLAGGTASLPDLDQYVSSRLELPVCVANPFVNMRVGNNVDVARLAEDAPAMMLATGLALRSFDE